MPTTFPADYRRHAIPRLRAACRLQALGVVTEDTTFSGATLEVISLAYRLGAGRLPDDLRLDLHDRIGEWLLEAVDAAQEAWELAELRAWYAAVDVAEWERRRWPEESPS